MINEGSERVSEIKGEQEERESERKRERERKEIGNIS